MQGVGRIYQDFRDGVLQDDDEVSVLHGPEELGYPPVTEAMVNIRATLAEAARCGILGADEADQATRIAKTYFYKDRTWPTILDDAVGAGLHPDQLRDFAAWLPANRVDQKRIDAEAMLAAVRAHRDAGIKPFEPSYTLAETVAWRAARRLLD